MAQYPNLIALDLVAALHGKAAAHYKASEKGRLYTAVYTAS
jgi:hypothetical protein